MKTRINDFTEGLLGVFIALDGLTFSKAVALVSKLTTPETKGRVGYKVNDLLHDPGIVQLAEVVSNANAPLFVDAKLHDIPSTVWNTTRRIVCTLKPQYMTVHASGGETMVKAASVAAVTYTSSDPMPGYPPKILAVTVLTSLDDDDVADIYQNIAGAADQVRILMNQATEADGFVTSAKELSILPEGRSDVIRVVPGIRPEWYQNENPPQDDQKRVATPSEAIRGGATHLVIGRPIVKAKNPLEALLKTLKEIDIENTN